MRRAARSYEPRCWVLGGLSLGQPRWVERLFAASIYNRRDGCGGNCTLGPVYVTVCPKCGYDTTLSGWPEMGREAEALRELVASWHSLTPSVRAAIIDLIR